MVFRPSTTPLPPSRGRVSFELDPSGAAYGAGPGPDDRRIRTRGTWSLEGDVLTLRLPGQTDQRFRVESVDADRLVVKRT